MNLPTPYFGSMVDDFIDRRSLKWIAMKRSKEEKHGGEGGGGLGLGNSKGKDKGINIKETQKKHNNMPGGRGDKEAGRADGQTEEEGEEAH